MLIKDEKEEDKEYHAMACEDEISIVMANEDAHEGKETKVNEAEREYEKSNE